MDRHLRFAGAWIFVCTGPSIGLPRLDSCLCILCIRGALLRVDVEDAMMSIFLSFVGDGVINEYALPRADYATALHRQERHWRQIWIWVRIAICCEHVLIIVNGCHD